MVQFNGPVLELMTESRTRFDQRLAALGPDILADEFDAERFLARLRADDPTRGIGEALLDQRNVAGIGNIWKSEGCWEAALDPWRPVSSVSDEQAMAVISAVRPRMPYSARHGRMQGEARVFRRAGRPCPRCGGKGAGAWSGRRQPHGLLVPGLSALICVRKGAGSAYLIRHCAAL